MGYMRHHAIVVTTEIEGTLKKVYNYAKDIGCNLSDINISGVNGVCSFCVFPDGSKEGWADSHKGDFLRDSLVKHIESIAYDDGSGPIEWVEVQYGDDYGDKKITRSSL